jgi:hypothetical protein
MGNGQRETFMKSRVTTVIAALALIGGSGGAVAIGGVGNKGPHGGAAKGEYWPGKGCGDKNHQHRQQHGNIKPCPSQSKH